MFVNAKVAAITALFFVAVVSLQGVTAQETSQTPLRAKLAAELRANAEQLNRASLSRLFTAVADPDLRADLRLTEAQVALFQLHGSVDPADPDNPCCLTVWTQVPWLRRAS